MQKGLSKTEIKKLIKEIFTKKSIFISTIIIVVLGLIVSFLVVFWPNQKNINNLKESIDKQTPNNNQGVATKGALPIAPGSRSYSVRTDTPQNPKILTVDFDRIDAGVGEEQTIKVKVEYKKTDTITSKNKVFVTYYTDNGSSTLPLKLKKLDGPPITSLWQGVWKPNDTHDYVYMASINAISEEGNSKVTLSFR